jgi:hypothetical protein
MKQRPERADAIACLAKELDWEHRLNILRRNAGRWLDSRSDQPKRRFTDTLSASRARAYS